jgi:hypothetical protein
MATATAMWHSGKNPLHKVTRASEVVPIPRGLKIRRLHKAFLRWHDANNWPMLREALKRMGRADLIGSGKRHLVPAWQPAGTGEEHEGRRMPTNAGSARFQPARTQHTGLQGVSPPAADTQKAARAPAAGKRGPARRRHGKRGP